MDVWRALIWRVMAAVLAVVLLGVTSWTTLREDPLPGQERERPVILCVPVGDQGYQQCEGFSAPTVLELPPPG